MMGKENATRRRSGAFDHWRTIERGVRLYPEVPAAVVQSYLERVKGSRVLRELLADARRERDPDAQAGAQLRFILCELALRDAFLDPELHRNAESGGGQLLRKGRIFASVGGLLDPGTAEAKMFRQTARDLRRVAARLRAHHGRARLWCLGIADATDEQAWQCEYLVRRVRGGRPLTFRLVYALERVLTTGNVVQIKPGERRALIARLAAEQCGGDWTAERVRQLIDKAKRRSSALPFGTAPAGGVMEASEAALHAAGIAPKRNHEEEWKAGPLSAFRFLFFRRGESSRAKRDHRQARARLLGSEAQNFVALSPSTPR